jgi:hypothetical protein
VLAEGPGPDFFSDQSILSAKPKEQMELVKGIWIYEIAELSGMRRTDVESIKAFTSRQNDRGRWVWSHAVEDQPRRCIFFGTTNRDDYLMDNSNRRFWPVNVGRRIDTAALLRDRDQLWAEAAQREAASKRSIPPRRPASSCSRWSAPSRNSSGRSFNRGSWRDLRAPKPRGCASGDRHPIRRA